MLTLDTIEFTDTFNRIVESEDLGPACESSWHEPDAGTFYTGPAPGAEWLHFYPSGKRPCGCPRRTGIVTLLCAGCHETRLEYRGFYRCSDCGDIWPASEGRPSRMEKL